MSNFFKDLLYKNLIHEWTPILDWLFDDSKFDKKIWSSGFVGSFTKKVKKLDHIRKDNYEYCKRDEIIFPTKFDKNDPVKIKMVAGNGEARDIIRHIRNGVAHGQSKLLTGKEITYIEIIDYNKNREQTAYISLPIEHIGLIYKFYLEIEKNIAKNNEKSKKVHKNNDKIA